MYSMVNIIVSSTSIQPKVVFNHGGSDGLLSMKRIIRLTAIAMVSAISNRRPDGESSSKIIWRRRSFREVFELSSIIA